MSKWINIQFVKVKCWKFWWGLRIIKLQNNAKLMMFVSLKMNEEICLFWKIIFSCKQSWSLSSWNFVPLEITPVNNKLLFHEDQLQVSMKLGHFYAWWYHLVSYDTWISKIHGLKYFSFGLLTWIQVDWLNLRDFKY